MSKNKTDTKKEQSTKSPASAGGWRMIFVVSIIMAAVFLPSSVLLFVGMMPTLVAALTDWGPRRTRAITVGAMNLAGCSPFLFQLWSQGHTFEASVDIFTNPETIVVMYGAAAIGYLIDWTVSGLVAGIVYQQGLARKKAIKKRHTDLVDRWGPEVTGEMPLDPEGFSLIPLGNKKTAP
jgi:hypothetical protein